LEKILSTSEVGPILALIAPSPLFENNQMKANPDKFQALAVGKKKHG
jgi:hypothetical protein